MKRRKEVQDIGCGIESKIAGRSLAADDGGALMVTNSFLKKATRPLLLAGVISVIIAGLHGFLWLHAGCFCGDEVDVMNLAATRSLSMMTHDSFPVLLPVLVNGWSSLGLAESDTSLRLLGLSVGILTLVALWCVVWPAHRSPPWWSLILFGLNGTLIFWTGYLRAYGLGTALILLTLAAMIYFLMKPGWRRALLLGLMAVLSVQALYQNAVFFASIGLGGWAVCWLRKDKVAALKIFVVALAAAASLLPYYSVVLKWGASTAAIRPGFSWMAATNNLDAVLAFPLPQHVWIWRVLGLGTIGLGVAAFFRRPIRERQIADDLTALELQAFAGTVLMAALLGYFAFLHFAALITSPWYFLPLTALAVVCVDMALPLEKLPRLFRPLVFGILLGTAGIAVLFSVRDLNCRFSNMDLVANRLKASCTKDDYIVVTPWHLGISFNRYYHGEAQWDTLPPVNDHATYRFDLVPVDEVERSRLTQPVLDRVAATLQNGHRVWVVGWMEVPAPGRQATSAEGRFIAAHSQIFEKIDLKIKGQVSDYENVSLLMAGGSATNEPLPAPAP